VRTPTFCAAHLGDRERAGGTRLSLSTATDLILSTCSIGSIIPA